MRGLMFPPETHHQSHHGFDVTEKSVLALGTALECAVSGSDLPITHPFVSSPPRKAVPASDSSRRCLTLVGSIAEKRPW